jgi:MYXO-CTERM domain-containing protein
MRIYPGFAVAFSLALVISCGIAHAGPLNLTQNDPDATSDELNIVYNSTNDMLSISGLVASLSPDYPALYNTNFTLTATIPNSIAVNTPTFLSTGTLSISASVNSPSAPVQTLFSGSALKEFAFSDPSNGPSPLFDFIFSGAGGTELNPGANVGVEVSAANTLSGFYPNFFTASFNNNTNTSAVSDAYNVPEPTGLSLLGVAALGLIRRRRTL